MAHDPIIDAVRDDSHQRGFDRWVREQGAFVHHHPAPAPEPIRTADFWRAVKQVYDGIGKALDDTYALLQEPCASDLISHLIAAREGLLPLMREAQAREAVKPMDNPPGYTLTEVGSPVVGAACEDARMAWLKEQNRIVRAKHEVHEQTPPEHASTSQPPSPLNPGVNCLQGLRKHVLTHNALAQLLACYEPLKKA
jgi:hypothetical protein